MISPRSNPFGHHTLRVYHRDGAYYTIEHINGCLNDCDARISWHRSQGRKAVRQADLMAYQPGKTRWFRPWTSGARKGDPRFHGQY